MERVPVIWDYNYDEIIGFAVISDKGEVQVTFTDPRIVADVKKKATVALSFSHYAAMGKENL